MVRGRGEGEDWKRERRERRQGRDREERGSWKEGWREKGEGEEVMALRQGEWK